MAITNHISFCWSVKHGFEFLVMRQILHAPGRKPWVTCGSAPFIRRAESLRDDLPCLKYDHYPENRGHPGRAFLPLGGRLLLSSWAPLTFFSVLRLVPSVRHCSLFPLFPFFSPSLTPNTHCLPHSFLTRSYSVASPGLKLTMGSKQVLNF